MITKFDQSVVDVLYGGEMLKDSLDYVMLLGSLELVKLYASDYDVALCAIAASVGRLDVIEWLRNQNPPCYWDEWTC
tara:strand:- start:23097 stop:23327 length:231 start_codon:yes stop_codon:yes gene_type:complete